MTDRNAFDRQLEREIGILAGPEPRVHVREIVEGATTTQRRIGFGRWFGSAALVAAAGVLVLVLVLGIGPVFDRSVVVDPAASPTADPLGTAAPDEPEPVAAAETAITGTWFLPQPMACRATLPAMSEVWIHAVEVCDGLRFEVPDDPRMTGMGHLRHEILQDESTLEVWRLSNDGGAWESQRYQDHDRFIFRGAGGYSGLTAVVTLAADGTLIGLVRDGEPREDDE